MDIKELGKQIERTILSEQDAEELEKRRPFNGAMTPLHGLFAKFAHNHCYESCFSKSAYYRDRCMSALCFARWLVLHGYAKFTDEELDKSLKEEMEKE